MTSSRWRSPLSGNALGVAAPVAIGGCLIVAPRIVALVVPVVIAAIASVVLTRLVCTYPSEPALSHRITRWSLGSFCSHLALGLLIVSSFRLTTYLGGDSLQYHGWAQGIVSHWTSDAPLPADLPTGKTGFPYLLAALYWIFGPFETAGLAINAFFASGMVVLTTDTTRRLYGSAAAWWVPPILALPVGFLLWPAQLLREAAILFFIAMSVNAAARLEARTRLLSILTITAGAGLLMTFRSYMGLTLAGGLVVGLVLSRRGVGGVGAGAAATLLVFGLVAGLGVGFSGVQAIQTTDFARVNNIRMDSANSAASGFLEDADVSSGSKALVYLPIALPRFLLGPFPWEIRPGRQMLAIPDVLVWWALIPSMWRGFWRAWRKTRRGLFLLVLPAISVSVVLALLVANYGTIVRARMQVLLLLAPLAAFGIAHRRSERADAGAPARTGPVPSSV